MLIIVRLVQLLLMGITIGGIILCYSAYNYLNCQGEVTGVFVKGETEDYGDYCGQYPRTLIVLENFTSERLNPPYVSGWLRFDNYYPEISNLIQGHVYTIGYSKGSRPSDATTGDSVTVFYIDNIIEVDTL